MKRSPTTQSSRLPVPLLLCIVIAIGAWLRFDRLTAIPPSLSHDESAIAYNAYSVLKTGKDEYGERFPVLFRSFDDYKLPGMVYSTIPFAALFGRSELTARLPSAVFGTLAIVVIFGIAYELTGLALVSLLTALALAVQPWHVNFSRQLFESNGATFWLMCGTYFLLRSRHRYADILPAGICYVAALYFYYSVRLVIPFMLLFYLSAQWKTMRAEWKTTSVALFACFILFLPLGRDMFSAGGWQRINTVSVVNDPNYLAKRDRFVAILGTQPSLLNKIRYNSRIALVATVVENYWKNISPHNLFVTGTGTYGALYPFDMILVPVGLAFLFTLRPFSAALLLIWLVTAFLPGAFSINQPNTLRTLVAAPAFALLSGFGWYFLSSLVKPSAYAKGCLYLLTVLMLGLSFPKFYHAYFVNNPTNNALAFADGTKQMAEYVTLNERGFDRIYISGYYWRPYIFMLYWGKTAPDAYQDNGSREHFGTYYFSSASWDTNGMKFMDAAFDFGSLPHDGNTLFILAYPEYELHRNRFIKVADIDGTKVPHVFVAALLK